ncbi:MAG: protein-L-isoaspartate O-methyltransferase [Burkholderiales bacterium]|nr:protein-L-isoaspartate O-methyltransferase [Burkholderiales bacterium]
MTVQFDVRQARFNMIEQQIRPWDVLDQGVLDLLTIVRREDFVPAAHRQLAFSDLEIPLRGVAGANAPDAAMWTPKLEARVLQELAPHAHDTALEIGSGSGYFAALLGHRCKSVLSVEIDSGLAEFARANLKTAGVFNVRVAHGDGATGFGGEAYDIIVLSGSTPILPEALVAQLKPGGRMFAVVGDEPVMAARLITRTPEGIAATTLFETCLPPLKNAAQPNRFRF